MRSQPPWMFSRSIRVLSIDCRRRASRRPASASFTRAVICRSSSAWVRLVLLRRLSSSGMCRLKSASANGSWLRRRQRRVCT